MIKRKIEECIALTDAVLNELFCPKSPKDIMKQHMDKDCLWIGANDTEYLRGKDAILSTLNKGTENFPDISITDKKFECVDDDRKMAVISGRYFCCCEENQHEVFRDMQRVTFIWKEKDDVLWLVHFHVSSPMNNVQENEGFPHTLGVFTKKYLERELQENKKTFILVKDVYNVYQKIMISDILYIESFDKNSIIHLIDEDILAKVSLSKIENQINKTGTKSIIRVQKSFAVHKFYVNALKKYELEVAKKYIVPISRNRYDEIQKELFAIEEKS